MTRPIGEGYTFTGDSRETHAAFVTARLQADNRAYLVSEAERLPLEIYALDGVGNVVRGLVGKTVWGWLEIGVLWVADQLHRQGLGSELMRRAEAEARRRGCRAARLSTWDFQAPAFYKRLGYVVYGMLEDYPTGRTVYYLRKDLIERAPPAP